MTYYDRRGAPIDIATAARLLDDASARRVGLSYVGDIVISTVCLVIGNPCDGTQTEPCDRDAPRSWCMGALYETLSYGREPETRRRYHTLIEAIRGHAEITHRIEQEEAMS